MDYDINELCKELEQQIAEGPICEAAEGEYVDVCHWSRTGWAVWRKDGSCSCRPALAPPDSTHSIG